MTLAQAPGASVEWVASRRPSRVVPRVASRPYAVADTHACDSLRASRRQV